MTDSIWYTHCPPPSALGIAVRQGWVDEALEPLGVTVKALADSTDPEVHRSHFDHSLPNSFRQGGNIPPLAARSRGSDVRLIGISRTEATHPILVDPDSSIFEPRDLAGKRIAVPVRPNASVDFWKAVVMRTVTRTLGSVGLTINDVELVTVEDGGIFLGSKPGERRPERGLFSAWGTARSLAGMHSAEVRALFDGKIDAIAAEGMTASMIGPLLGLREITVEPGDRDRSLDINNARLLTYTVSGGLLEESPEIVDAVLAASHRAAEWSAANEFEAKLLIALESGIHPEYLDSSYGPDVHRHLGIGMDEEAMRDLASQHDFLLEMGLLEGPVDLEAFAAHGPLERTAAAV
jgi:ABC-type nitrate/sulfonate/bicarbonate transport system substrate-binding protein